MSVPTPSRRPRSAADNDRNAPRPAQTRKAILDAAQEFLWSHPFRDMTVRSLMATVEVSRPAFYQYFEDVHELMETLLTDLKDEILVVAGPWFFGAGDPVELVRESLDGLVRVCYRRGPILRAVSDAASYDSRMETAWTEFLASFDDAVAGRIEADQAQDLIPAFDARPLAISLNRLDAFTFIDAFGARPRRRPQPILVALQRLWVSSLYGSEWVGKTNSSLVREAAEQ